MNEETLNRRYDRYVCKSCEGTGRKFDTTVCGTIGDSSNGSVSCYPCNGTGEYATLEGSNPNPSYAGEFKETR